MVSESGIRDCNDIQRLAEKKVTAALVGETLMRSDDRSKSLKELTGRLL